MLCEISYIFHRKEIMKSLDQNIYILHRYHKVLLMDKNIHGYYDRGEIVVNLDFLLLH